MKSKSKSITCKDSTSVDRYFQEIRKHDPVGAEVENELAKRIQHGDPKAIEELITGNLRFVVTVAKKYQGRGTPLSDLISEGNLGLIEAAKRFDPSRGIRFITYAVWWIRKSILASLDTEIKNQHQSIDAPIGEDELTLGDLITEGPSNIDIKTEQQDLKTECNLLLNHLSSRDREIIKSLFGIECRVLGIDEAGRKFGLTQQRIGQIRDAALQSLRAKV